MKILFIYNPNSGDESGKEFVGEVEAYLKKYFEEVILRETKELATAQNLLKRQRTLMLLEFMVVTEV